MATDPREEFYAVITEAIDDVLEHGFDSRKRLEEWLARIETSARSALAPWQTLNRRLKDALTSVFNRTVKSFDKRHSGVDRFTLASIKPKLRLELERRLLASADLITLNRNASIQRTLQRFAGWATSVPRGGSDVQKRKDIRMRVRRGIASLPFEERRVIIDQGHKLAATLNDIIAVDGGAIAAIWHHVKERGYDAREEHLDRDGKLYVIRDNWAIKRRFMKLAGAGYTDSITMPGEEINCRCRYEYLYTLRDLPPAMLTDEGHKALANARRHVFGERAAAHFN